MTDLQTTLVRENVRRIFSVLCASTGVDASEDSDSITESILIRDGFFCGRRFSNANLQAVWFVEENELKVYSSDGALLLVTTANERHDDGIRRAA